jgi:DNA-binding NarL/FixJ family response regulator
MENVQDIVARKATILIVEDHEALRDSLKSWLTSVFQDCYFVVAKSGEEALDQAQAYPPDVVLMDVMLPGMSGIEAARRIKEAVPAARVVMLSIYEDAAYKADAATARVSAYLSKRDMGSELLPLITRLLRGNQNLSETGGV